ncbi:hypothetical protein V1505DRAFT_378380, partial [Lipomyces doorenjongii]
MFMTTGSYDLYIYLRHFLLGPSRHSTNTELRHGYMLPQYSTTYDRRLECSTHYHNCLPRLCQRKEPASASLSRHNAASRTYCHSSSTSCRRSHGSRLLFRREHLFETLNSSFSLALHPCVHKGSLRAGRQRWQLKSLSILADFQAASSWPERWLYSPHGLICGVLLLCPIRFCLNIPIDIFTDGSRPVGSAQTYQGWEVSQIGFIPDPWHDNFACIHEDSLGFDKEDFLKSWKA